LSRARRQAHDQRDRTVGKACACAGAAAASSAEQVTAARIALATSGRRRVGRDRIVIIFPSLACELFRAMSFDDDVRPHASGKARSVTG